MLKHDIYNICSCVTLTAYIKRIKKEDRHLMTTICQLHSMQLQKEVKSNPAVKKVCGPQKKAIVEKYVKSKVQPRNGCGGRLLRKIVDRFLRD